MRLHGIERMSITTRRNTRACPVLGHGPQLQLKLNHQFWVPASMIDMIRMSHGILEPTRVLETIGARRSSCATRPLRPVIVKAWPSTSCVRRRDCEECGGAPHSPLTHQSPASAAWDAHMPHTYVLVFTCH